MSFKINIHNFWRSHTFIVLMFAIMSIMSAIVMWHAGSVISGNDEYFHWQRIYDLRSSIMNGNFHPLVALNQFHQTGSAVMSMYPNINLYPLVLLTFVVKSFVNLFYVAFIGRNFLALLVAYFASFGYNRSKKISFIFAITYVLNNIVIFHVIQDYDLGRSASIIFIPLTMFGFMELLKRNHWIELTIGMSLIILCHVLNSALVALFLLSFAIINIKKFLNHEKILALLKAIFTTLLITSVFLIPFVIIMKYNSVSMPPTLVQLWGARISDMISIAISNQSNPAIDLSMLIGLILGLIRYKKLPTYSKQLLWIAIAYLFVCSNLFPWHLLINTFVNDILQFSWRLYIIPEVILAYIFAEVLWYFFDAKKDVPMVIAIVAIATMWLQMMGQESKVVVANGSPDLVQTDYSNKKIVSNEEFHELIYNTKEISDYIPSQSIAYLNNIDNHMAYDGKKLFKVKVQKNGKYIFTNKKYIKNLSLPFVYYNGVNYQVKLDGKTVKAYPNKHALMTINNVPKGEHHVKIILHKSKAEIFSYVLSLIGLIILLRRLVKNLIAMFKHQNK